MQVNVVEAQNEDVVNVVRALALEVGDPRDGWPHESTANRRRLRQRVVNHRGT